MVKKSKHRKKCKKEISVEMAENIRQEPESKSDDFLKKYNSICKILRIKVDENRSDINQNTHDNSIKRLSEMMKVFVKAQVNVDELVNSVNGEGFKNLKIINSEEKKFVESNFRIRSVIDEYKEGLKEINVKKKEFYLLENSGKDVSLASNKLIEHYFDRIERVKELEKDIINLKNQLQLQV